MSHSAEGRQDWWIARLVTLLCLSFLLVAAVWSGAAAQGTFTAAGAEGPAQRAFTPPKGPAPAVIVISGQSGPTQPYQYYANQLSRVGYYTVLIDSNDIFTKGQAGMDALRKAMTRAQQSPHAVKGKVGVVGFSLGGGTALAWAANMPDLVSVVVAYYPFTSFAGAKDSAAFVKRFRVPILVMAGGQDSYKDCCLIGTIRAIEESAKKGGVSNFELVVYPRAEHNFDHDGTRNFRREDERDAWKRTQDMLRLHLPPAAG